MAVSADYLAYVLEQLACVEGVSFRRMFGGVGLYADEFFFGLIFKDTLFLRVDDSSRARYEARGMARFRPYADRPDLSMNYYEAPADALEDPEELGALARHSIGVARAAALKPARRPGAKRPRSRR